jgi:CheY-like chemotaxis protein
VKKVVLYIEDDDNDALFFRRAVAKRGLDVDLRIVQNGLEAIEWLSGKGVYADREAFPIPDVILTDLKLPYYTGFDVLRFVRANPQFQKTPVAIYTSSMLFSDMEKGQSLGANAFLTKDVHCTAATEFLANLL